MISFYIKSFIFLMITASSIISQRSLHQYNFEDSRGEQIKLPSALNEISGLTHTNDGKIFCHNDEEGVVFEIDPGSGKIIKRFQLGTFGIEGDFEDIAFVNDRFFLLESNGYLYEFFEGKDRINVDIRSTRIGFSSDFNLEGLCYDPETNSLLLACKDYPGNNYIGSRTVYSFSLKTFKPESKPRFVISLGELRERFKIKDFYPSAIARHPESGTFFILSAKGVPCLVEISAEGITLDAAKLKKSEHLQPEALTILDNGEILIGDEAAGKYPVLTKYKKSNN